jgi:hypothetical protein
MVDDRGFDPAFDFTKEVGDKDPDEHSRTLRDYHKLLWSKPLPSGRMFDLEVTFDIERSRYFLHHQSSRGEFYLTSDSVMQTWTRRGWKERMGEITEQVPDLERKEFLAIAHQIGGKVLFPGMMQVGRKQTINQVRGTNKDICDRFDLTLECIRLHYLGKRSHPLAEVLTRYWSFFELFDNFKGYTDFFLLQDLVSDDSSVVKSLIHPFTNFKESPLPGSPEAYQLYRENGISFVQSRNRRMEAYVARL